MNHSRGISGIDNILKIISNINNIQYDIIFDNILDDGKETEGTGGDVADQGMEAAGVHTAEEDRPK